eukprot:gene17009-26098_t
MVANAPVFGFNGMMPMPAVPFQNGHNARSFGANRDAMIRPVVSVSELKRPCEHNQWKKQTKKRGKLVLRCNVCNSAWKTRPELHQKCANFHAGKCTLGGDCPHPHIYARRENASKKRAKQDESEFPEESHCCESECEGETSDTTSADESNVSTSSLDSTASHQTFSEYSATGAEPYPYMFQYTCAEPITSKRYLAMYDGSICDSQSFDEFDLPRRWVSETQWSHCPYSF